MPRAEKSKMAADNLTVIGADNGLEMAPRDDIWNKLKTTPMDTAHLARNRVISALRSNPAHGTIDLLRTRLLQVLRENNWTQVAITSATSGCGNTFVASNLAVSLARSESRRVVLMDMNLRKPNLAEIFGVKDPQSMRAFLSGILLPEEYFVKAGPNLALGLNSTAESNAAELALEDMTADVLAEMKRLIRPDVVIYDLPPVLAHDDMIAFLPQVDGVLIVVGGGENTADEIRAVEQALGDHVPLLGFVLNKAQET